MALRPGTGAEHSIASASVNRATIGSTVTAAAAMRLHTSGSDIEWLEPHLEIESLQRGTVLYDTEETIHSAFFPHDTIVSLVSLLKNGGSAEMLGLRRSPTSVIARSLPSIGPKVGFRLWDRSAALLMKGRIAHCGRPSPPFADADLRFRTMR